MRRQHLHAQFVEWMNEWMNERCVFPSRRDGGRERRRTCKSGHMGPQAGAQRQEAQVVVLDNKKQDKSPDWFLKLPVHLKAMQPCSQKSHVEAGLQSTLNIPEPTALTWASSALKQHSDSRCLWALTLNVGNGVHFSSFSFVGVHYFYLITGSLSLGHCFPMSILWNTNTARQSMQEGCLPTKQT